MRGMLSLVTLGIASARDSVYAAASHGYSERPSMMILAFLAAFILVSPLYFWMRLWFSSRRTAGRMITRPRVHKSMLTLLTFLGAVVFVQLLLGTYTNKVIMHFNQTLTILSPYLSPEEQRIYQARFAKVQSRQDFAQLFAELNAAVEAHGERPSRFSPW